MEKTKQRELPVVKYVAHDVPNLIRTDHTTLSLEHLQNQGSLQSFLFLQTKGMKIYRSECLCLQGLIFKQTKVSMLKSNNKLYPVLSMSKLTFLLSFL